MLVTRADGSHPDTAPTEKVAGDLAGSIEAPEPGNYYLEVRSPAGKDKKFPPLAYTVSPSVNAELPHPELNYGFPRHIRLTMSGFINLTLAVRSTGRGMLRRRFSVDS